MQNVAWLRNPKRCSKIERIVGFETVERRRNGESLAAREEPERGRRVRAWLVGAVVVKVCLKIVDRDD